MEISQYKTKKCEEITLSYKLQIKNEKQKIDQEKLNVKQKEEEEEVIVKAISDKKLDYSSYL